MDIYNNFNMLNYCSQGPASGSAGAGGCPRQPEESGQFSVPSGFSFANLERFAFENIRRPAPVFRPAGFIPPPELDASGELRRLRRRGLRGEVPPCPTPQGISRAERSTP